MAYISNERVIGPARSGVTLIEVMVVVSIIVLLASLTFPVLVGAKHRVKKERSVQQMKQLHLALILYCEEEEHEGPLGLGLPPDSVSFRKARSLPRELFRTGGSSSKSPGQAALYTWMPPALHANTDGLMPLWNAHVARTDRNPIFLVDETFTPNVGQFSTKFGVGIFFDGHLENRRTRGSLSRYSLWEDNQ